MEIEQHNSVFLNHLGLVNGLGRNQDEVWDGLMQGDCDRFVLDEKTVPEERILVGACPDDLPPVPKHLSMHRSRNNQLLLAAVEQIKPQIEDAVARWGAESVGVVLGSSTSGIREGEDALAAFLEDESFPSEFHVNQQGLGDPAEFIAEYLGVSGPAYTISTACTSSAKAIASAGQLIRSGMCRAVVTGGGDALCRLTLNGFFSLEAMSRTGCNPMSVNRDGLLIGEAAALFLMTGEGPGVEVLGVGESSDAHHISAPQPDGLGAEAAMRGALEAGGVKPEEVCYVNLHGTATPQNDAMESRAVSRLLGEDVVCSSTKAMTGHTLGAAGATEVAICWMMLDRGQDSLQLPPHCWDGERDPDLPTISLVEHNTTLPTDGVNAVISNSFAFGGNNCSVLLGRRSALEAPSWTQFSLDEVLPHGGDMIMLDEIINFSQEHAVSRTRITSSNPFFLSDERGVPMWIGYEIMAQTMAAYSGIKSLVKGEKVKVGLLVSNRKGVCHVDVLTEGRRIQTEVKSVFESGGVGVFDCRISDADTGEDLMEASVNVYLPDDLKAFLEGDRTL